MFAAILHTSLYTSAHYSRIELELNSDDGLINLLEERTDVANRMGELQDSSMHARLLGKQ